MRNGLIKTAIYAGGLGGLLDIVGALGVWLVRDGVPPLIILQAIASGLVGPDAAYAGGWTTGAAGLVLHLLIAVAAAAVFGLAARRLPELIARPWLWGAAFGLAMWAAMNFIVLPLSLFEHQPIDRLRALPDLILHLAFFGPAVAVITARMAKDSPRAEG